LGQDGGTLIQDTQADSRLVFVTDLHSDKPRLRQLNLTNASVPTGAAATTATITATTATDSAARTDQLS
jgi:hypothetical protein